MAVKSPVMAAVAKVELGRCHCRACVEPIAAAQDGVCAAPTRWLSRRALPNQLRRLSEPCFVVVRGAAVVSDVR